MLTKIFGFVILFCMANDLNKGSTAKNLISFSLPFLLSYFLQTLYGLADLFIIGQFNGAEVITAVSVGSQVMHMFTVMIVGLANGATVMIAQSIGARDEKNAASAIGTSATVFVLISLVTAAALVFLVGPISTLLSVPQESVSQTRIYLAVCFAGIPFITAYNVISAIFRGLGDSKSPMIFVAVACVVNIAADYILIGIFDMKALGAALGTVLSQAASVVISLIAILRKGIGVKLCRRDFIPERRMCAKVLGVGVPVAVQDGFIQVSFLVITAIANSRGVEIAAAVGIVEKIIGIMFLIPSSMLSAVSAIVAQNVGAGQHKRASLTLRYAILIAGGAGLVVSLCTQFCAEVLVGLFTSEPAVVMYGGQYLRTYVFDCIFAGIHFSCSGYFIAYQKSILSFLHNLFSVVLVRVPFAYLATLFFPSTLYQMGIAAPAGSLLSCIICAIFLLVFFRQKKLS